MAAKPQISCMPNGPYSYLNEGTKTFFCRCGGSKNKPFCDGTHRTNGFTDASTADPARNKRKAYAGKGITIFDNRALCAHAAVCTDELAAVFRQHDKPWIVPDAAAVEKAVEVIRKCPSGALSYAIDGIEAAPPQRPAMVTAMENGPYAVSGGIELVGVNFGEGASREHYTLCRCGASKNKPFCDGSHWDAGFKAPYLASTSE